MEQVYDCDVLLMCKAFVNKDNADKHCDVDEVFMHGNQVQINYSFPTSFGTKSTEWKVSLLELMAFVWSQTP